MKQHVVVYRPIAPQVRALLEQHVDLTLFDQVDGENRRPFLEALRTASGILGTIQPIDREILDAAPQLRAASSISAGLDAYDIDELTRRGILLTHVASEVTQTTADMVFGLILASARRIVELAEWARRGEWRGSIKPPQYGVDVHHQTIGIVGLGRIGAAVAQRAALGFGMKVLYTNRSANPAAETLYGAERRTLDQLLAEADFVVLLTPLSEQTHHMIGAAQLARMKPSAILINGGRGPVVDEAALIEALRERRILGAGLDVFDREPLSADSPLFSLPNVVALPHIGSATAKTRLAMATLAAQNLLDSLAGKVSTNCANPEALEHRR
jgi:gluconate 2-dehydrogenase